MADFVVGEILSHPNFEIIKGKKGIKLSVASSLVSKAREVLSGLPSVIRLRPPITIVGDVHGQLSDLISIFRNNGFPPTRNYLFLGDYVDRGDKGVEVLLLLFSFLVKYPNNFFLLRGNHEDPEINKIYGFRDECIRKYGISLFRSISAAFSHMPISAVIGDRVFCVHGGISPNVERIADIIRIDKPTRAIPDSGPLCDLLWSDPNESTEEFEINTNRLISFFFGKKALRRFLSVNGLDLLARGHEYAKNGYSFFDDKHLVTIFSAPNYYDDMKNNSAIVNVDSEMTATIKVFIPG